MTAALICDPSALPPGVQARAVDPPDLAAFEIGGHYPEDVGRVRWSRICVGHSPEGAWWYFTEPSEPLWAPPGDGAQRWHPGDRAFVSRPGGSRRGIVEIEARVDGGSVESAALYRVRALTTVRVTASDPPIRPDERAYVPFGELEVPPHG